MNILVTGGAGFVGSNLVKKLISEGHNIRILDNCSNGKLSNLKGVYAPSDFTIIGDVIDFKTCLEATKNIDIVFHLAALKSVPESVNSPALYNEVNINGTVNILEAAVKQNVKKIVFASSSSIYGNPPNTLPINETLKLRPISPYAVTKLAGEAYCRCYAELHGLNSISLRFFNIYGPGQSANDGYANVIPKFIANMLKDEPPTIFGDGSQARDYVHIDDVINALCLAATTENPHIPKFEDFNIGSGRAHTVNDIVRIINIILNKKIIAINASERAGDVQTTLAEINKAEIYLGYKPQVKFGEGMAQTVKYFQENQNV